MDEIIQQQLALRLGQSLMNEIVMGVRLEASIRRQQELEAELAACQQPPEETPGA